MSQWDRCITREPTTMFPVVYNNAYQIVQTPGYVLIVAEMIHDARIIPISSDGAARTTMRACARGAATHAVTGKARRWSSTPRTSTTAAGLPPAQNCGAAARRAGQRAAAHRRALHAASTTTRCSTRSRSTIRRTTPRRGRSRIRSRATTKYQMFEYACHEGNRAIELILRRRARAGADDARTSG